MNNEKDTIANMRARITRDLCQRAQHRRRIGYTNGYASWSVFFRTRGVPLLLTTPVHMSRCFKRYPDLAQL